MTEKLVCNLATGKWGPQKSSGSIQTESTAACVTVKDQRNPGVFNREEKEQISKAVREKYAAVASSAQGRFKYETGKKGAGVLGYEPEILKDMPDELLESFCGVGNPFSIWKISAGEDVLDIGCGAGFDLIVARRKVGTDGRVCGVDLTKEMISRARKNFELLGIDDIETEQISSEVLPFADNSFDAVISNGVINLSPAKAELFAEIYRVLRPGGRLQIADMVMDGELPPQQAASLEAWSQWIGGVISVRDQIELLQNAGFQEVECVGKTKTKTAEFTIGAHFLAKRR